MLIKTIEIPVNVVAHVPLIQNIKFKTFLLTTAVVIVIVILFVNSLSLRQMLSDVFRTNVWIFVSYCFLTGFGGLMAGVTGGKGMRTPPRYLVPTSGVTCGPVNPGTLWKTSSRASTKQGDQI